MTLTAAQNINLDYLSSEDEEAILSTLNTLKMHSHVLLHQGYDHYEQVIQMLADWHMPSKTFWIFIAFLYKTLEITVPVKNEPLFNHEILQVATKIASFNQYSAGVTDEEAHKRITWANKLRGLFAFAYEDPEPVLIIVADHAVKMLNSDTRDHPHKRLLFEESDAVYLPLLEFLGIWNLRRKLGNICLEFLNPGKIWNKIADAQKQYIQKHQKLYDQIQRALEQEQEKTGIQSEIKPHFISATSVYRRLTRGEALIPTVRQIRFDVVVKTVEDCYRVLKLIHELWEPASGKTIIGEYFRDLVSTPKFNGYRSLITRINYPLDETQQASMAVEFRIFTKEMEQGNGLGIIAYRYLLDPLPRKLKNIWWQDETVKTFMQSHPLGTHTNSIYVFSPIGRVYRGLPCGSTPIDYAYHIHSEVGNHCKRIWVNGQPAGYELQLKNGDLVEIDVDPKYQGPDERWLSAVKTRTAKNHIKQRIIQQVEPAGRQIIDKVLKRELRLYDLQNEISVQQIEEGIEAVAKYYGYSNKNALYLDIAESGLPLASSSGHNRITAERLVTRLITPRLISHIARADGAPLPPFEKIHFVHCEHGESKRASPGTKIVGRLVQSTSKNGGLFEHLYIYRADCIQVQSIAKDQIVPLEWLGDRRKGEPFSIIVHAVDRPGLLDQLLKRVYELFDQKIYLLALHADVQPDNLAQISMTLDSPNTEVMLLLNARFEEAKKNGLINDFQFHSLTSLEKLHLRSPDLVPNPFTTGPATTTQIFKGRDYEITKMISAFENERNFILVFGINRVGKTSLLRFVQNHIAPEYNFIVAFIDLQELASNDEQGFWSFLAGRMVGAIRAQLPQKSLTIRGYPFKSKENSYEAFQQFWKNCKLLLEGRKLLVIIDEFSMIDDVWDNKSESNRLAGRLRALIDSEEKLCWVICVQETIYQRGMDMHRNLSLASPILIRNGIPVRVDFIDPTAARKLIDEPVGQMLIFDDEVKQKILAITACHPYFLQNLLHEIVDQVNSEHQRHITMDRLEKASAELLAQDILFQSFLTGILPADMAILYALAALSGSEGKPVSTEPLHHALHNANTHIYYQDLIRTLEYLCDSGVLLQHREQSRQYYTIRVPLFRDWLYQNHPFNVVNNRPRREHHE